MGGENRPVCNGKTIDYPGFYRECFCTGENILDRFDVLDVSMYHGYSKRMALQKRFGGKA